MNMKKLQWIIVLATIVVIALVVVSKAITPVKHQYIATAFSVGLALLIVTINRTKPIGTTILGVATICYGVFAKGFILIVMTISVLIYKFKAVVLGIVNKDTEAFYAQLVSDKPALLYAASYYGAIVILFSVLGIGIFRLKKWAWYLAFIVIAYHLFYRFREAIFLIKDGRMFVQGNIYNMLFITCAIAAIVYLLQPKVKEQFK